jgi:hypothetical protein
VDQEQAAVAFFDVGVGPLAALDRLDEVLFVGRVGEAAVQLVPDHRLPILRPDVDLPAAAHPAHVHHALLAVEFDPRGVLGPIGPYTRRWSAAQNA